jgi:hypothetical protein
MGEERSCLTLISLSCCLSYSVSNDTAYELEGDACDLPGHHKSEGAAKVGEGAFF